MVKANCKVTKKVESMIGMTARCRGSKKCVECDRGDPLPWDLKCVECDREDPLPRDLKCVECDRG